MKKLNPTKCRELESIEKELSQVVYRLMNLKQRFEKITPDEDHFFTESPARKVVVAYIETQQMFANLQNEIKSYNDLRT